MRSLLNLKFNSKNASRIFAVLIVYWQANENDPFWKYSRKEDKPGQLNQTSIWIKRQCKTDFSF